MKASDEPLSAPMRACIDAALAQHGEQPGPLLQVLHAVQADLGHIPPPAIAVIAQSLNISRAEVYGVVTFYHYFRQYPPGRSIVQVCQAESCRAVGGQDLSAHAQRRLGVGFHETTTDGAFTLEPVYCLGNCACSPAVMIDGELHGRVTPQRFDALVSERMGRK